MSYTVVYAPEAEGQLASLYLYVSQQSGPDIALGFTEAIMAQCEKLSEFPRPGQPRDDLRPGLRTIAFRRRVTIAYAVFETEVVIFGNFYGGQDFAATFLGEE